MLTYTYIKEQLSSAATEKTCNMLHHSHTHRVYTNVDAQCDGLATVVSHTRFTTLTMVNMPWRNFSKSRVWDNVQDGSTVILEDI